jgi:hypothetical protein
MPCSLCTMPGMLLWSRKIYTWKGESLPHPISTHADSFISGNTPKRQKLSRVLWTEVEHQLKRARADLLVIFDCCYAGHLANVRSRPKRIFEYIGATQADKVAEGPGDYSFTKALIWALQELANEPDGFTPNELVCKIKTAPKFKTIKQEPVCSPRDKKSALRRLGILPLGIPASKISHPKINVEPGDAREQPPAQCYLRLQLAFGRAPNKQHLKKIADAFKEIIRESEVPLRDVCWKGTSDIDLKLGFPEAAMIKYLEVRSRSRSISPAPSPVSPSSEVSSTTKPRLGKLVTELTATALVDTSTISPVLSRDSSEMDLSSTSRAQPPTILNKDTTFPPCVPEKGCKLVAEAGETSTTSRKSLALAFVSGGAVMSCAFWCYGILLALRPN